VSGYVSDVPTNMKPAKPLNPAKIAVDEYVRSQIEDMIADRGPRAAAKDLGIKHPTPHNISIGRQGVGPEVERQWAAKFFRGSVDELRRAALAWYRSDGGQARVAEHRAASALPYPRMQPALDMARDANFNEDFLRDFVARAATTHGFEGRSSLSWWNLMQGQYEEWLAATRGEPSEFQQAITDGRTKPAKATHRRKKHDSP